MVYVFAAEGFEEIETITVIDLFRRAGGEATLVSVSGERLVTGSRGVTVQADCLLEELDDSDLEMAVLPGGLPGVTNLGACSRLKELLCQWHNEGRWIAAICAAPALLEQWELLGERATVSKRFVSALRPERLSRERVVVSDRVITSRSPGTAIEFSLEIISILLGSLAAQQLSEDILFPMQGGPGETM